MPSFLRSVVTWLALPALALVATAALAQEYGPDALVRAVSHDVIAAIKQNRDIRAGNRQQLFELVEKMILPHVDTARMTQLAMGLSWRKATPEQQQRLTQEFTTLLVHTYSGALASYSDRVMNIKPLRAQAGATESRSDPRSDSRGRKRSPSITPWARRRPGGKSTTSRSTA